MRINFKKENTSFQFIKENDRIYFYHSEGCIVFTKENVKPHIYDGINFRFEKDGIEYVFASNLGEENTINIIFAKPTLGNTHHTIRYEYWLCPRAISNLYKLAYSL